MEPAASPPSPSPLKHMHRRYVDPGRRCKHCRWVEFTPQYWMRAYKLEKGRWKYVDKVFDDKQKDVPFPEPVLDTRKDKDILGKKKRTWGWQRQKN